MAGQCAGAAFIFGADGANMHARDIAKGNIIIHGDRNKVHTSVDYKSSTDLLDALDWLSSYSVNHFPRHEKARMQRASGTGCWFFGKKEYKTWAAVEGDGLRNLECIGIPGAGKTTIASSVIETLEEAPATSPADTSIALYAYFRHDAQTAQTITHVLASLLHQTIRKKNELSPEMIRLYKDYSSHKELPPAPDKLVKVLRSELSAFKTTYIIIDALDEFRVDDYSLSHPLVIQLQLLGAKLLITSRHPVGFAVNTFSTVRISAHAEDVRQLVQTQITGHLIEIIARSPGLLDEIVNTVIEKSEGMFIIAKLLVDSLSHANTANSIRKRLQELPTGIHGTYRLTMERVRDQESELAQLGMKALMWVYLARRRLTVKELQHAVSFEPGMETISRNVSYVASISVIDIKTRNGNSVGPSSLCAATLPAVGVPI